MEQAIRKKESEGLLEHLLSGLLVPLYCNRRLTGGGWEITRCKSKTNFAHKQVMSQEKMCKLKEGNMMIYTAQGKVGYLLLL